MQGKIVLRRLRRIRFVENTSNNALMAKKAAKKKKRNPDWGNVARLDVRKAHFPNDGGGGGGFFGRGRGGSNDAEGRNLTKKREKNKVQGTALGTHSSLVGRKKKNHSRGV